VPCEETDHASEGVIRLDTEEPSGAP